MDRVYHRVVLVREENIFFVLRIIPRSMYFVRRIYNYLQQHTPSTVTTSVLVNRALVMLRSSKCVFASVAAAKNTCVKPCVLVFNACFFPFYLILLFSLVTISHMKKSATAGGDRKTNHERMSALCLLSLILYITAPPPVTPSGQWQCTHASTTCTYSNSICGDVIYIYVCVMCSSRAPRLYCREHTHPYSSGRTAAAAAAE